jgi:hypothetical protein
MVMTGKNCSKSLIFQSVSMAMVHGFSGSDLEPVSSGIFLDDFCIIFGMCISTFLVSQAPFVLDDILNH